MVKVFNAKTIENFLSEEECKHLMDLAIEKDLWQEIPDSVWDKRSTHIQSIYNGMPRETFLLMQSLTLRIKDFIESNLSNGVPVYPDIVCINRWFPGMSQPPHADDMTNTDIKGLEARAYGSIIYLNTDYAGGHTYYPTHDVEIVPQVGMAAIHPGDVEHLHGVTEVQSGMRYTISSFWVKDKDKGIDWSIYQ